MKLVFLWALLCLCTIGCIDSVGIHEDYLTEKRSSNPVSLLKIYFNTDSITTTAEKMILTFQNHQMFLTTIVEGDSTSYTGVTKLIAQSPTSKLKICTASQTIKNQNLAVFTKLTNTIQCYLQPSGQIWTNNSYIGTEEDEI